MEPLRRPVCPLWKQMTFYFIYLFIFSSPLPPVPQRWGDPSTESTESTYVSRGDREITAGWRKSIGRFNYLRGAAGRQRPGSHCFQRCCSVGGGVELFSTWSTGTAFTRAVIFSLPWIVYLFLLFYCLFFFFLFSSSSQRIFPHNDQERLQPITAHHFSLLIRGETREFRQGPGIFKVSGRSN